MQYENISDILYIPIVFSKKFMLSAELNKTINKIVSRLQVQYTPEKVILFGSSVQGSLKKDSDIDLLIIKDTNQRFIDRWITVRKIISDPYRKFAVDTLILTPNEISERISRGDQFVADIIRNGEVLYAA
jgi:uncharacterized protein